MKMVWWEKMCQRGAKTIMHQAVELYNTFSPALCVPFHTHRDESSLSIGLLFSFSMIIHSKQPRQAPGNSLPFQPAVLLHSIITTLLFYFRVCVCFSRNSTMFHPVTQFDFRSVMTNIPGVTCWPSVLIQSYFTIISKAKCCQNFFVTTMTHRIVGESSKLAIWRLKR